LLILLGLPNRILLGDENHPEYAVDIVGVEVTRVEPLENTENLKVTRGSAGKAVFTIVTNLEDIKVGQVRAAAILPPAEFKGVISEAMYSSDPIDKNYIGKRVPRKLLSPEVKGKIISLFGK
ncbi:MAG: tRNA-binding protein, partial [Desulfurococcales archaeon]|nr:tRNA-binding protein [Desulfurococcales archaeon]